MLLRGEGGSVPADPDRVKEPQPCPWFASGRCTHPSRVRGGGTPGQAVLGGAEGVPQYSLHGRNGGGGTTGGLSCGESTPAACEPHGGRATSPSETPRRGCAQVGDATAQCSPHPRPPPPKRASVVPVRHRAGGGPGVPKVATDGWRQLADTCPSSPPLSCPSFSSPLVLFDFPTLWVQPEGSHRAVCVPPPPPHLGRREPGPGAAPQGGKMWRDVGPRGSCRWGDAAAEDAGVSLPAAGREFGVRGAPLMAGFPLLRLAWPAGGDLGRVLPPPPPMEAGGPSDQQIPQKAPTRVLLAPATARCVQKGFLLDADNVQSSSPASPEYLQFPPRYTHHRGSNPGQGGRCLSVGFCLCSPQTGKAAFPALGVGLAAAAGCGRPAGRGPAPSVMSGDTGGPSGWRGLAWRRRPARRAGKGAG